MQNSAVLFSFSILSWECLSWANLSQKSKLSVKAGTWHLNMKNSVVMFIFSAFDRRYPFLGIYFKKSILFVEANSRLPRLILICGIQRWFSFFIFLDQKYAFWVNLIQKFKIVSLSWNLLPRLFRMCKIQWRCSLFLF